MYKGFPLLTFILFYSFSWGQAALEYKLSIGDTFTIKQIAVQHISQEFEGYTHELENNIDGVLEFTVAAVEEDGYKLDMSFLDLGMQINSSVQGILMQVRASELDEEDAQSRIFHSILNVPIRIVLHKSGHVSAVHGGDALIEKMTSASGLTDSISKQALRSSLKSEFGSEALSNSFEQMTYIYPEKDSTAQNSWKNEYNGKLSARNEWTLEKASDSINHIKGKSSIIMNISDSGTIMKLSGEQETLVVADVETGFILDMSVEGKASGIAVTEFSGDTQIPTTISSKTTYKQLRD